MIAPLAKAVLNALDEGATLDELYETVESAYDAYNKTVQEEEKRMEAKKEEEKESDPTIEDQPDFDPDEEDEFDDEDLEDLED